MEQPSHSQARRLARRNRKAETNNACVVYGLREPGGVIRYVGQTKGNPRVRLSQHKRDSERYAAPVYDWLRKASEVEIVILEPSGTWNVSEILMIDKIRREYPGQLLNVTRGGDDTFADCKREGCIPDWYTPRRKHRPKAVKSVAELAGALGIKLVQPWPVNG